MRKARKKLTKKQWLLVGLAIVLVGCLFILVSRSDGIVFVNGQWPKTSLAPDPVERYAPELRLHPDEKYFPIDINDFVTHSSLWFAHDLGCDDSLVDAHPDLAKLGSGGYAVQQKEHSGLLQLCKSVGRAYRSNEYTRPFGDLKRPDGLSSSEGYYLDLVDTARHGSKPVDNRVVVPMYYNYKPGQYITYWFVFGRDPKANALAEKLYAHEGDWERLTVRLNKKDEATQVDYFQHGCPAEPYSWQDMQQKGFLTKDTHPIAYSAKGTHATYPTPIHLGYWPFRNSNSCPGELAGFKNKFQGNGDVAADNGPVWQGWKIQLVNAETQGWYGFGGAWGQVGGITTLRGESTGQPGPPHRDPGLSRF